MINNFVVRNVTFPCPTHTNVQVGANMLYDLSVSDDADVAPMDLDTGDKTDDELYRRE